jgi:S1-C subfamily serine protease
VAGFGLGLAIPINDVTRQIVAALIRDGRVRRAYVGIAGGSRPLPPRAARLTGRSDGAEVVDVVSSSPAARAGLRPGDVVYEIAGIAVGGMDDVQRILTEQMIGRPLVVRVIRDGELLALELIPAELGE